MILSAHGERQASHEGRGLLGEQVRGPQVNDDLTDVKSHLQHGHIESDALNVRISKNSALLSTLAEANKALQRQQVILEKLVVMKLNKQKQESRTEPAVDEMLSKLAEVRSRQSALEQRNETMKQLIAKQQELLQTRMQRRKALLERSAARTASLRAELRRCEEAAQLLQQQLDDEYVELDNQNNCSQTPSQRDEEMYSDCRSEEWFAEDELSFSPEEGQDLEGYLQRRTTNDPVVIRHPENFLREKSLSCCTRDEFLVGIQSGQSQHKLQYRIKVDSAKAADLDVTDIQEEDSEKTLQSEQPSLTDLIQRSKSQLPNLPTEHSKKIKKNTLQIPEAQVSRNIGIRKLPARNPAVFSSPTSWRSEASSSASRAAKINFPIAPVGLDSQ
jgi:hypothetical protein